MANVTPKVSILMPVRIRHMDEIEWLRVAVASIKSQTVREIELVLVDDGSQPGAVQSAIAEVWDSRFHFFRTVGLGVSAARNLAALKATAELILPVDADDRLAPDTVEQYLRDWRGEGFLYPAVHIFDDAGNDLPFPPEVYDFDKLLNTSFLLVGNLHKREDWQRIGGWSPAFKAGFEDWDYWIRLGVIGVCGTPVPEAVYYYRRNPHGRIAALRRDPITGQGARDQLQAAHRALYEGVRPMACCGGGRARNGGGAESAPRAAVIPELPGSQRGLVLIEYVGGSYGLAEWPGVVTGNRHVFSADPANRFGWVDPADLETGDSRKKGFLELRENTHEVFRLAPQPATSAVASQEAQGGAIDTPEVIIPVPALEEAEMGHLEGPDIEPVELPAVMPVEAEPVKRKPGRKPKAKQAHA